MPTLIDREGLREDRWTWFVDDDAGDAGEGGEVADAPAAQPTRVILSLAQWQTHAQRLLDAGVRLGICLEPAEGPEEIASLLDRVELVAIRFPAFTDGRGYSSARLLRQRYGWQGELRAVGDVLRDQMFYLSRCGFDSFDLKDGESVQEALAGFRDFSEAYQAAADRGPLFRRRPQAPAREAAPQASR
jgi:uncharacterized protein (DUF934 family)